MEFLFWAFQLVLAICVLTTVNISPIPTAPVAFVVLVVEILTFAACRIFWGTGKTEYNMQWKGAIVAVCLGIVVGITSSQAEETTVALAVAITRIVCAYIPAGITLAGIGYFFRELITS